MQSTQAIYLAHGPTTPPAAAEPASASKVDTLLPWILGICTTGPFALLVDGGERWLALGLAIGLAIGAGISWYRERVVGRQAREAIRRAREDMQADADGRVAMVIRQFQWAVNDVAALQQMHAKSKDAARTAEDRARRAEHQVRLLELQLYRAKGKAIPRAGEPALAATAVDRVSDGELFLATTGDLFVTRTS